MSTPAYDSQEQPRAQEEDLNDRAWNEVVTTKLPADLEEQARLHKAWSRKRGVSSVSDLLRALLVYACCQYSFRELGMWAVLKGIGSLSERAWRKRLEQSQRWIAWLLSDLLGVHQRPAWLPEGVGRVRIIDATRWKTVGGTGDDVRLHQSYDLATGKMDQVQLTTRYQAESLSHFALAEGDLMVTDAGYPVPSSVEVTQQSKSFLLQRTTASHLHIEDEQGQTMILKEKVKGQRADSLKQLKGWIRLPKSGERTQVRLLCYRLPEEQASKARDRKTAKLRKKHGRKYNQELVWWASWVLLVTTTDEAMWSGQDLVYLYRARWQIELLFKRIKQCLRLHRLVLKDWERVSCVLHLNLIAWWLQEQEAQWLRDLLTQVLSPTQGPIRELYEPEQQDEEELEESQWVISSWTVTHFCCEEVRTMLRGAWTRRRKQECEPALCRYVLSRKRKRGHRETEQRAWLEAKYRQLAGRSVA
jgi:Transposase DDE domain